MQGEGRRLWEEASSVLSSCYQLAHRVVVRAGHHSGRCVGSRTIISDFSSSQSHRILLSPLICGLHLQAATGFHVYKVQHTTSSLQLLPPSPQVLAPSICTGFCGSESLPLSRALASCDLTFRLMIGAFPSCFCAVIHYVMLEEYLAKYDGSKEIKLGSSSPCET